MISVTVTCTYLFLVWIGVLLHTTFRVLKSARSYFSQFSFIFMFSFWFVLFCFGKHHFKDVNFKFQLERSSCSDVRSNFVYCNCNYSYHNQVCFIIIVQTEHYSAVKIDIDNEKNMTSLVILKSPNDWKDRTGWAPLKTDSVCYVWYF